MRTIAKALAALVSVALILFLSIGGTLFAAAETQAGEPFLSQEDGTVIGEPVDENALSEEDEESVADRVKAYLQSIYGDDYKKYYDKIIENWGSVENFLLNASDNLPEEYRYKATELITTVNAYIGVVADIILLLCGLGFLIYIIKKHRKIKKDLATLKACDNQIEVAQLAIIKSQKAQSVALKALMPGEKFADAVAELAESAIELDSASEEVKKIV